MSTKFSFLLLLLLSFSLYSCVEYKDVEVIDVSDIRVKSLTTSVVEVEFKMQINNPNNYKISVVDSDLELFIKDKKIGSAKIQDKIVLPKKSNKKHTIVVETGLSDMLTGAIPILMGLMFDSNIELQVKGEIRARAKSLSKSFPVDFKERVEL
tara:strand:- start:6014 stop:6472 length:459 start_codon:yes stop_codon:yes gene_type:complete